MNQIDRWVEHIQIGMPEYFRELLERADRDAAARAALAELGGYLRNDGQWRAQIKLQKGWDGHGTTWDALAAFVAKYDDGSPWWKLLDYVDGKAVTDEVEEFFASGKN